MTRRPRSVLEHSLSSNEKNNRSAYPRVPRGPRKTTSRIFKLDKGIKIKAKNVFPEIITDISANLQNKIDIQLKE